MRIPRFPSRRAACAGPLAVARRLALGAALLAGSAVAAPGAARAQDITVCAEQSVPPGYAVVAAGKGQQCPGYYAAGNNVLTLRLPGDTLSVCKAYTPSLPGYAVVAAGKGQQCPGYYASGDNVISLRLPGDTISVCSAYTSALDGYVVTARGKRQDCPNYYGSQPNSASYRRIAQPYAPPPPPGPATEGMLPWLSEYSRYVMRRLRTAEGRLRLDEPTHEAWRGVMGPGSSLSTGFEMEPGIRHTLVAVCDQDCAAIAIRVRDPAGAIVAVSEAGTQAVIRLPPATSGRWTVEASVQTCTVPTCRFGVGIYETPDESAGPPRRPRANPER